MRRFLFQMEHLRVECHASSEPRRACTAFKPIPRSGQASMICWWESANEACAEHAAAPYHRPRTGAPLASGGPRTLRVAPHRRSLRGGGACRARRAVLLKLSSPARTHAPSAQARADLVAICRVLIETHYSAGVYANTAEDAVRRWAAIGDDPGRGFVLAHERFMCICARSDGSRRSPISWRWSLPRSRASSIASSASASYNTECSAPPRA